MNITMYRQEVRARQYSAGTREVLMKATKIAQGMDHDFMDPIHVLLAVLSRPQQSKLEARLVEAGLNAEVLDQCARAMTRSLMPYRSRVAIELMFERATGLAADRYAKLDEGPRLSLGDIAFACIISGSRVIDTVIRDGLQTSIFATLIQLNVPDKLALMYFPADTVEDIVTTKMTEPASQAIYN